MKKILFPLLAIVSMPLSACSLIDETLEIARDTADVCLSILGIGRNTNNTSDSSNHYLSNSGNTGTGNSNGGNVSSQKTKTDLINYLYANGTTNYYYVTTAITSDYYTALGYNDGDFYIGSSLLGLTEDITLVTTVSYLGSKHNSTFFIEDNGTTTCKIEIDIITSNHDFLTCEIVSVVKNLYTSDSDIETISRMIVFLAGLSITDTNEFLESHSFPYIY